MVSKSIQYRSLRSAAPCAVGSFIPATPISIWKGNGSVSSVWSATHSNTLPPGAAGSKGG